MTESVQTYLAKLPKERRAALEEVRDTINMNIPAGYEEQIIYGMIGWVVPLSKYPKGYLDNPKQPLTYAALASQKNYMSLYLMSGYELDKWLRAEFQKRGKKLDKGKACIRFKKIEDLPLDVVAAAIKKVPVKKFIAFYEERKK